MGMGMVGDAVHLRQVPVEAEPVDLQAVNLDALVARIDRPDLLERRLRGQTLDHWERKGSLKRRKNVFRKAPCDRTDVSYGI